MASASASSRPGTRKWFEEKNYAKWLHEDIRIREFVKKKLNHAGVSKVEIERAANKVKVNIHTARPGIVIGKRGAGIETVKKDLQQFTENEVFLNIVEVRKAETNAQLVAENIATQLERRIAFRRAMKKALQTAMKFGAKGIRVACSGRLGGAEMARYEWYREGRVPLHTLRADIEYGFAEAKTTYGTIGCKVWIFRGEVLPDQGQTPRRPPTANAPVPPSGATLGLKDTDDASACAYQVPQDAEGPHAAARPTAAATSPSATSACMALQPGWITSRQIEAARIAMTRHVKRGGKIWIRVFPDKPVTKKPAETRMGTGKGGVEYYVAVVKPGRILYEMEGMTPGGRDTAR